MVSLNPNTNGATPPADNTGVTASVSPETQLEQSSKDQTTSEMVVQTTSQPIEDCAGWNRWSVSHARSGKESRKLITPNSSLNANKNVHRTCSIIDRDAMAREKVFIGIAGNNGTEIGGKTSGTTRSVCIQRRLMMNEESVDEVFGERKTEYRPKKIGT